MILFFSNSSNKDCANCGKSDTPRRERTRGPFQRYFLWKIRAKRGGGEGLLFPIFGQIRANFRKTGDLVGFSLFSTPVHTSKIVPQVWKTVCFLRKGLLFSVFFPVFRNAASGEKQGYPARLHRVFIGFCTTFPLQGKRMDKSGKRERGAIIFRRSPRAAF